MISPREREGREDMEGRGHIGKGVERYGDVQGEGEEREGTVGTAHLSLLSLPSLCYPHPLSLHSLPSLVSPPSLPLSLSSLCFSPCVETHLCTGSEIDGFFKKIVFRRYAFERHL